MDDGLGDWRISAVGRLAKDIPAETPGGLSHKAGSPIYHSCLVQTEAGENVGFTIPSATAMALNVARCAGRAANDLKLQLVYKDTVTPDGPGRHITTESTHLLYDYFEQCMISATFSFQALEVFCNHAIMRSLKEAMYVKRRGKRTLLSPEDLERQLSTEEKLSQVLPKIKGVPTPKGKRPWEPFKRLKEARDSTIHLKLVDQHSIDHESLFFQFLNQNPESFPEAAIQMIHYFETGREPRWLKALLS